MTTTKLIENLKAYLDNKINEISLGNPLMSFMKPLVVRAIDKNFGKISGALSIITDEKGNIDAEGILSEMFESVTTLPPFPIHTEFLGDIIVGGGMVRLNIPLTDKQLVFNTSDLEELKSILTKTN